MIWPPFVLSPQCVMCIQIVLGGDPFEIFSVRSEVVSGLTESQRPVVITQNGEPKAVLQYPQSYDNICKAIGLLQIISLG